MGWVNENVLECGKLLRYIEVFELGGRGKWRWILMYVMHVDGNVVLNG